MTNVSRVGLFNASSCCSGTATPGPDWTSRLVFGRFPLEVVSLVMSRKMMLNITRLADRET